MKTHALPDFPPVATEAVRLDVNGRVQTLQLEPRTHLADALRDHCGLTATHLGCEHGVCGACTVEVDGAPQRACLQSALRFAGRQVRTLEAFDDDGVMAELRAAFNDQGQELLVFVHDRRARPEIGRFDQVLDYQVRDAQGRVQASSRERLTYYAADPAPFARSADLEPDGDPIALGQVGDVHVFRRP